MRRLAREAMIWRVPGVGLTTRIARRAVEWLGTAAGASFWSGALGGLYAVAFCHQFFARFGGGLMASCGAAVALALGLLVAAIATRVSRSQTTSIGAALIPAAWAVAIGWLADSVETVLHSYDLDSLASPAGQFAACSGAAVLLLGVPIACAGRLAFGARNLVGSWACAGAATGCLVAAFGIGPWFGLHWAGLFAAAVTVAWSARIVLCRVRTPKTEQAEIGEQQFTNNPTKLGFAGIVISSVAAGMTAAALDRLVQQLVPGTEAIQWAACAGFLLGAATTWRLARGGNSERGMATAPVAILFAALGCTLPVVLFRPMTDLFLAATATFSSVSLLMSIRALAAALTSAAAGAMWAAGIRWQASAAHRQTPELRATAKTDNHPAMLLRAAPAVWAGALAARWLALRGVSWPVLAAGGVLLPATLALVAVLRRPALRGRLMAGGAWSATAAMIVVALFARTYEPSRAARLLFSTKVFMAWRTSTEARLLPFLDDNRLLVEREGECGTFTLWKQRGIQLALRESGIPCGTYSPRPEIGPQFSGEVVPCVLPLVLHEAPRHVLILGLGSGSGLSACLEFPIEDVTCVEADHVLIDILEDSMWPAAQPNPRNDNRARVLCLEPSLAVQSRRGSYDVVYADSGQSGVSQGTPHFTREFYAGAARQLAADGIFAQRFQQIDYGPWPLQTALATLRSVFAEVAAVEVAPGELVLLGTQSASGLARPHLLERFQTPQTRRTLAHLGWDWSIVLNLAAYAGNGCDAVSSDATINTAANGLFAFRLPQETMRWGPKAQELASVLSAHAGRIAQWRNVNGNDTELLRRLSDVMREHDLMTSYPDQPWAYRKLVREELTKHPHTTIEEGESGFERRLDPTDRRRVDYFTALGQAARAAHPTLESLRRIEEFAEPFDPVVTYFLHHELAAFYARSDAAGSEAQLQHRLYSVYYGDPRDRSVRDVVDALDILNHEPRLVAPDQRWDYLNALLGFLETRWLNRGLGKPTSPQVVLNDLERTIAAVESSLAVMDSVRESVGLREADWTARRSVLERAIVRPLRSYREELVPVYQNEAEKTASSQATETQPSAN
jgi:hypothetical protein